jgi:hypothetical protein
MITDLTWSIATDSLLAHSERAAQENVDLSVLE